MAEGEGRSEAASGPAGEGRDQWELALAALGRRRLFRLALAVLLLLYGAAIWAPVLANDRPLLLEAVDRGSYERARRSLPAVALGIGGLARGGEEAYLAGRTSGSVQTWRGALAAEHAALSERVETMRRHLPAQERGPLERLEELAVRTVAAAGEGGAAALADALAAEARAVRDALAPLPPRAGDAPREDGADGPGAGVRLVAERTFPLAASLGGAEVGLMALWLCAALWPAWNRLANRFLLGASRARIRRWRWRKLALVAAFALLVGGLWELLVGGDPAFHTARYKEGLTKGEIVAQRAWFPPLALGFAETHLGEQYRPPTWTAAAEISEQGYYVRGPRVPLPDPVTGRLPEPQPVEVRFGEPGRNAATRHLFGTDLLGRDLFVRALWGARVSLSVGIVSTVILVVIGTVVGALAGYLGGRVDLVISRLIEVVLCFPVFFLVLVVVAFVGPSVLNVMVVIGLLRWTGVARLARAEFLRLKQQDFVVAARALGLSTPRTVFRHVLPNAMGPILVAASFSVAAGILIESGLSFLGFGVELPVPSWGSLVNESRDASRWWIQVFPGALIFLTVLCYNLVGDAVRDALDPRTRR